MMGWARQWCEQSIYACAMRQWYNFGCGFDAAVPQRGLMGAQSHNQKHHRGVFRERLETHVDAESSWKENKKHDDARVLRCQEGTAGEPM